MYQFISVFAAVQLALLAAKDFYIKSLVIKEKITNFAVDFEVP